MNGIIISCTIIVVILIINIAIILCSFRKKNSLLFHDIKRHCLKFKKIESYFIIKIVIFLIYVFYFLLNPFSNIFRYFSPKYDLFSKNNIKKCINRKWLDTFTEVEVTAYLFLWIGFYSSICNSEVIQIFMIWRIIIISLSKIQEITFISDKNEINFQSFNRTFILTFINFLELILIYAYLYSHSWFYLFDGKLKSIRETLYIFVNWNVSDQKIILCKSQEILLYSQVFIFIIIFMILIGNISTINYKDQ